MDYHTNYGAARSSNPPPPYSDPLAGSTPLGGRHRYIPVATPPTSPSVPFASAIGEPKRGRLSLTAKLTLLAMIVIPFAFTLFQAVLPVIRCNNPLDPDVRDRIREEWNQEVLAHEREVAKWEAQKAQWKQEEEERKRLNVFWDRVEAHHCTTYGTREYTAVLANLPMDWKHPVEACRATPLEIHGVSHLPKTCEDKGSGFLIGRWEINQYEPDCASYWNRYKDKERSGKRRIEFYLENLPKGGDWREFCATTPVRFHGMEFAGAHECYQWNYGTYGLWEIEDFTCQ